MEELRPAKTTSMVTLSLTEASTFANQTTRRWNDALSRTETLGFVQGTH
jgi:hypothetical protein